MAVRATRIFAHGCLCVVLTILLAGEATAAAHCVNPGGTGGCFASVQAAIAAAASGDVVDVAAGTYDEQIVIGPPKRLTLQGAGAGSTILQHVGVGPVVTVSGATRAAILGITIQGGGPGLQVDDAGTASVASCTIQGSGPAASAGRRSRLALEDCTITGNGGAEGAVESIGSRLDIARSAISGNSRGGVSTTAKLDMVDSSVQDNGLSGVQLLGGRIRRSTVSGNLGFGVSVGRSSPPGGGTVGIESSTIHGNAFSGVFVNERYAATLDHVTVANNGGAGVVAAIAFYRAPGRLALRSSIVSGHTADCVGGIRAGGANLVEDPSGCTITGPAPITGDPLLGPLQDNGGPTETRALIAGSPALSALAASGACRQPDQRGVPRTAPCDLGALEAP